MKRRKTPGGFLTNKGYHCVERNGKTYVVHVEIAEQALGKPLPPGAIVHHGNGIKGDNRNDNLVICPDETYHRLLHQRMAALAASGHVDWRKCNHCKQYDDPKNLTILNNRNAYHKACVNAYNRAYVKLHPRKPKGL